MDCSSAELIGVVLVSAAAVLRRGERARLAAGGVGARGRRAGPQRAGARRLLLGARLLLHGQYCR